MAIGFFQDVMHNLIKRFLQRRRVVTDSETGMIDILDYIFGNIS
jgi:hypothetical protein